MWFSGCLEASAGVVDDFIGAPYQASGLCHRDQPQPGTRPVAQVLSVRSSGLDWVRWQNGTGSQDKFRFLLKFSDFLTWAFAFIVESLVR